MGGEVIEHMLWCPPYLAFAAHWMPSFRPTLGPVIGLRQCFLFDPLSEDQLGAFLLLELRRLISVTGSSAQPKSSYMAGVALSAANGRGHTICTALAATWALSVAYYFCQFCLVFLFFPLFV